MKKLTLMITLVFSGILGQAQTDIDLCSLLIGQSIFKIDSIFDANNVKHYLTHMEKEQLIIYVQKNQSVRMWIFTHHGISKKVLTPEKMDVVFIPDGVAEIFIRYKHNALNDLRDFTAEVVPEENPIFKVEKTMGNKMSDIKITLK